MVKKYGRKFFLTYSCFIVTTVITLCGMFADKKIPSEFFVAISVFVGAYAGSNVMGKAVWNDKASKESAKEDCDES